MKMLTCAVWLDLASANISDDVWIQKGTEHGIRAMGGRLVVHYQIRDEGIERLEGLMRDVLGKGSNDAKVDGQTVEALKLDVE